MPLNIPYDNFVPLTTIYSSQTNSNNNSVKTWADAHEIADTGIHGVGTGFIVGTDNPNTFLNINTFSNAVYLRQPGAISNANLGLGAGVLRIFTESNIVPTSSAPCLFRRQVSNNTWETLTFNSTTYCTIQDATSADSYFYNGINGTPWGTTAGVAWADRMPLFIYVASSAGTPCLFLARKPNLTLLPSANYIGYANNPPTVPDEDNVFGWTINNVTGYASTPCYLVGFVEATKNTNDDWTFYPLSSETCGIGSFNFENKSYTMPSSQNGAASGSYFLVSAGTAPTYGSNLYSYKISRSGQVFTKFDFINGAGNTPGAGGAALQLMLPLKAISGLIANALYQNGGTSQIVSSGYSAVLNYLNLRQAATSAALTGNDQNNVIRRISGSSYFYL